jgi:hypothetical protein
MFGFLSAIGSAIGSFVSTVAKAIAPVASALGSALKASCEALAPVLGAVIEKGVEVIKAVAYFATAVLQVLGIFQPHEEIQEMGDRALQAGEGGIHPEDFDSYDEYMEKIRAFELDPEKSRSYSLEQKFLAGMAVGGKGLEAHFNADPADLGKLVSLFLHSGRDWNSGRVGEYLKAVGDFGKLERYFNDQGSLGEAMKTEAQLVAAERKLSPELSDDEAAVRVGELKRAAGQDAQGAAA